MTKYVNRRGAEKAGSGKKVRLLVLRVSVQGAWRVLAW